MPIVDRNLAAGTKLVARYKGQEYEAEVIEGEGGRLVYWMDGKTYKSPSAAGSAVMGGMACNGWRFWSVKGEGNDGSKEEVKPVRRKGKAKKAAAETKDTEVTPMSDEDKRVLLAGVITDPEATPETRVAAAEAMQDLGHIDCTCTTFQPGENGICKYEESGDCRPV